MSDDQNLPTIAENEDGFDEVESNDRIIQGELLKCVDGNWTDRDGLSVPNTPLLALSTATIIQRWENQKPIETIFKRPGQPFPDIDDLNAAIPQSEWEEGVDGNPRPPWQLQKVVYLLCELTAERYTFASGTIGAHIAVDNLRTRVRDMRFMRGAGVIPVVELSNKPMKTKFGTKLRPEFRIVGWRDAGGNAQQQIAPSGGEGGLKELEAPTLAEEIRDEVKY
jgi:hypothetical protein